MNYCSLCSVFLDSLILVFNFSHFYKAFYLSLSISSLDLSLISSFYLLEEYHSFLGLLVISSLYLIILVAFVKSFIALKASSSFHSKVLTADRIGSASLMVVLTISFKAYLIVYFLISYFYFLTIFFNKSFSSSLTRVIAVPASPALAVQPTQ